MNPTHKDWDDFASGRNVCTRCRQRENTMQLRLMAQERTSPGNGKVRAGRHLRMCDDCAKDVFGYTVEKMEQAAAGLKLPDEAARDALLYVIAYIEADRDGLELTDALDVDYLRKAASS